MGCGLAPCSAQEALTGRARGRQGKFMVLGGLKSMTGQLEFFSADDFEVLNAAEHFMCTDVEWDPTGRYVATAVNHMHQMENGFKVWLFNGQLLYQCAPRYPSLCLI